MTVSVILPCFNEKQRIVPIISALKKSKLVTEIIIVDDGSGQDSKTILSKLKGVKLISLSKNKGKSFAMKTGLLQSTGDIVAFIDADLQNFKTKNIDDLVSPIIDNRCDITLSDRTKDLYFLQGFSAAFTGERAFRRELLMDNLSVFKATGFLIEGSMNRKFFSFPKLKVMRVYFKNVSSYLKIKKEGLAGQVRDIQMLYDMVTYFGIKEISKQIFFATQLPHSNTK